MSNIDRLKLVVLYTDEPVPPSLSPISTDAASFSLNDTAPALVLGASSSPGYPSGPSVRHIPTTFSVYRCASVVIYRASMLRSTICYQQMHGHDNLC